MSGAVPASRRPPRLRGPVVASQVWRDVAFLHWEVDPAEVRPLLPAGTRPDLADGRAYVGLVPLRMSSVRVAGPRGVRCVPDFWETNVRVYSVDDVGRHGVVFLSLDADQLPFVLATRLLLRVPYVWSRMAGHVDRDERAWASRRRWPDPGPRSAVRIRVGEPVEPTALEVFLTGRWGLHSTFDGRTFWVPVVHEPWPLHGAEPLAVHDGLVPAAGLAVDGAPSLRALWSPVVHAAFGRPVRL